MSNPGIRLTKLGMNILAKGLVGELIHFTKVTLGDGDFDYDTESVLDLENLKSPKMDLPIVDKIIPGDGKATIVTELNNFNLEKGFRAKEIGIFALDNESGDEILYAYRNAGDEYNFVPAKTGFVAKKIRYAYNVEIGDAENVTFQIDFSFAYVPMDMHLKLKAQVQDLIADKIIPSANELNTIINNLYIPHEETGGLYGVPSAEDIAAIIDGTFIHYDLLDTDFLIEPAGEDFITALISAD